VPKLGVFSGEELFNATCQLDLEANDLILLIMPADSAQTALERVLAAVGQCLDRLSAESLLRLRADTEMQGRIEELADKCTEGRLTPEERDEYEALIRVGSFVAILQAKSSLASMAEKTTAEISLSPATTAMRTRDRT